LNIEKDYLPEVPLESARLCDLCGNFAHFAVKYSNSLQFPKTEPKTLKQYKIRQTFLKFIYLRKLKIIFSHA
jgi:hypothetical protein